MVHVSETIRPNTNNVHEVIRLGVVSWASPQVVNGSFADESRINGKMPSISFVWSKVGISATSLLKRDIP